MAPPIQTVARLAFQTFSKQSDRAFPENLLRLKEAVRKLKADDLKFDPNLIHQSKMESENSDVRKFFSACISSVMSFILRKSPGEKNRAKSEEPVPPVTYISVSENDVFTMGIFVLKHGTRIPLHDHPGMHGVLKVIHGTILVQSFTPAGSEIEVGAASSLGAIKSRSPSRSPSLPSRSASASPTWSTASSPNSRSPSRLLGSARSFDVIANPEVEVGIGDDVCVVSPKEGNLHEICAPNGAAAFLDILAPPYLKHQRDCHYYAIDVQNEGSPRILRVLEIRTPHDFWTDSAEYVGPSVDIPHVVASEQS